MHVCTYPEITCENNSHKKHLIKLIIFVIFFIFVTYITPAYCKLRRMKIKFNTWIFIKIKDSAGKTNNLNFEQFYLFSSLCFKNTKKIRLAKWHFKLSSFDYFRELFNVD